MGASRAICCNEECSREWTLQKQPEAYAQGGPRCPDCGGTDVEIETSAGVDSNGTTAAVFDALEGGAAPVDLVREHGLDPEEARRYLEDYDDLSDTHVVTADELNDRLKQARAAAEAEAEKRVEAERERRREAEAEADRLRDEVDRLRVEAREEWRHGVEEGAEVTEAELREECAERIETARQEAREAALAQAEARLDELRETAGETIADLRSDLERARAERVWLADALRKFSSGAEGELYALGHADGVVVGMARGIEEGKREGALELAKVL